PTRGAVPAADDEVLRQIGARHADRLLREGNVLASATRDRDGGVAPRAGVRVVRRTGAFRPGASTVQRRVDADLRLQRLVRRAEEGLRVRGVDGDGDLRLDARLVRDVLHVRPHDL